MSKEWFYDCWNCGDIGRAEQLKEHDTRPMPDDVGFCPSCGKDVGELFGRHEISIILAEYDEDPDAFIAALPTPTKMMGE